MKLILFHNSNKNAASVEKLLIAVQFYDVTGAKPQNLSWRKFTAFHVTLNQLCLRSISRCPLSINQLYWPSVRQLSLWHYSLPSMFISAVYLFIYQSSCISNNPVVFYRVTVEVSSNWDFKNSCQKSSSMVHPFIQILALLSSSTLSNNLTLSSTPSRYQSSHCYTVPGYLGFPLLSPPSRSPTPI